MASIKPLPEGFGSGVWGSHDEVAMRMQSDLGFAHSAFGCQSTTIETTDRRRVKSRVEKSRLVYYY